MAYFEFLPSNRASFDETDLFVSISLPFVMGIGSSVVLRATVNKGVSGGPFIIFMGVSLSITAFPVLARILTELKLLTTDLIRMAMSAAAVNEVVSWVLLALAIALSGSSCAASPASTAADTHSSGASLQTAHRIDSDHCVQLSENLISSLTMLGIVYGQSLNAGCRAIS